MNEVVETIINHKYQNPIMRKQAFICRRTSKQRIKNKSFAKLLNGYLIENCTSIVCEAVKNGDRYMLEMVRIADK